MPGYLDEVKTILDMFEEEDSNAMEVTEADYDSEVLEKDANVFTDNAKKIFKNVGKSLKKITSKPKKITTEIKTEMTPSTVKTISGGGSKKLETQGTSSTATWKNVPVKDNIGEIAVETGGSDTIHGNKKSVTKMQDKIERTKGSRKVTKTVKTEQETGLNTGTKALIGIGIAGVLWNKFGDKIKKVLKNNTKDEVEEYMENKNMSSLKKRFARHGLEYLTGGAASDIAKAGLGVGAVSALTLAMSARKGAAKGLANFKMHPMIRKLRKSDELSGVDFNDIKVKNLIKTMFQDYPNVAKNYYVMHDIINQYQEFGVRGVGSAFFKQIAELENRLKDGASPKDYLQALPEGKSKKMRTDDPSRMADLAIKSGLSLVKAANVYNPMFIPAKNYYASMLKMAYEIDRINESIASYERDPLFKTIADGVTSDFVKEAKQTIEDTKDKYKAEIEMYRGVLDKLAAEETSIGASGPTSPQNTNPGRPTAPKKLLRKAFNANTDYTLGQRGSMVGTALKNELGGYGRSAMDFMQNHPLASIAGLYFGGKALNTLRKLPALASKADETIEEGRYAMRHPLNYAFSGYPKRKLV